MLQPETTGRLVKLILMLGSNQDGEALNAARMIDRTLKAAGEDLHTLVEMIDRRTATGDAWAGPLVTPGYSFANTYQFAGIVGNPDELTRCFGLPVYTPKRIESWMEVCRHCRHLNRTIVKKHGGRFLRDFELTIIEQIAEGKRYPTNRQAAWLESVLARCHQARDAVRRADAGHE